MARNTVSASSTSARSSSTKRMSMHLFMGSSRKRERKVNDSALAGHTLGPTESIVPLNDAADAREPNAGALELRAGVQPLKNAEQLVRVACVEADAVIAHEKDMLLGVLTRPDLDLGAGSCTGELECVVEQAREDLPQHRGVTLHFRQCADMPPHIASVQCGGQRLAYLFHERGQVDDAAVDFHPADTRKAQQIVDQLSHPSNGNLNEAYVFCIALIQTPTQAFLQQRDETRNLPQRRAQVVADGVAERLELCVGLGELVDALGKLFVELANAFLGLTALLDLCTQRAGLAKQIREHGDLGAQHCRLNRLGQEVYGAGLVSGDRVLGTVGGQEEDVNVLSLLARADDLRQLDSAHAGHLHI